MHRNHLFVVFMLCTLPLTAFAGGLGCRELSELDKEVQGCEQNGRYTEAASLCVAKFDAFVKAEKAALRFDPAPLAARGEQTAARLDSYLANIVFPDDFDAPASMIGDRNAYVEREKCYSGNRDRLEGMIEKVRLSVRELNSTLWR